MVYFWLISAFLLGAIIGSFLNVCIARLPVEKSLLWPQGSRCGSCYQPVRWYDNIPLLSYWLLRGRCRMCGAEFSIRYFVVELLTGLGFAAIFYLAVIENIHQFPMLAVIKAGGPLTTETYKVAGFVFLHHATLFSFLMIVSACDLDQRAIPLSVTMTGTAVGLLFAILLAWPWPYTPQVALAGAPVHVEFLGVKRPLETWALLSLDGEPRPKLGLYVWPVWGPLPAWLGAADSWQMGLGIGLVGLFAGSLLLRGIRFVFNAGMGAAALKDRGGDALGLGDADLMMMAGAFLGWQPVIIAFFVAVFPGLFFGILQLIIRREGALAFGPSLAFGIFITMLGWESFNLGPAMQSLFFSKALLLVVFAFGAVFMPTCAYILRLRHRFSTRNDK